MQTALQVAPVAPVTPTSAWLSQGRQNANASLVFGQAVKAKASKDFHLSLEQAARDMAVEVEAKAVPLGHGQPWLNGHPHCVMGHVLSRMGIPPIEEMRDVASCFEDNGLHEVGKAVARVQIANDITQTGIEDKKRALVASRLRELAAVAGRSP